MKTYHVHGEKECYCGQYLLSEKNMRTEKMEGKAYGLLSWPLARSVHLFTISPS